MLENFYKFLDNEINLQEFEKWIYESETLENTIGEDNYQFLLEFNYNKKWSEIESRNFILQHITNEQEFSFWKVNRMLELNEIEIPSENLYLFAQQNPKFLDGKELRFKNYWTAKEIEIVWTHKITKFVRNTSKFSKLLNLLKDSDEYLYLGSYYDDYIHLVVNQKNEIWLAYDVVDKEEYYAKNINEALAKLFILKEQ